VKEFSGGMAQRLGIALLALADAPVLLLDEPTTGLDPEACAGLRELLAAGRNEGKTALLTSHILSGVAELADRVPILVQGHPVTVQPVSSLRHQLMTSCRLLVHLLNPDEEFVSAPFARWRFLKPPMLPSSLTPGGVVRGPPDRLWAFPSQTPHLIGHPLAWGDVSRKRADISRRNAEQANCFC